MQTQLTNSLSISRTNPSRPQSTIPIMALELESRRRREPPNDGLVASLFSRLAAMLAIEQAGEYSTRQRLNSPAALRVESNALRRTAEQESCRLTWNHDRRLYELQHPSFFSAAAAAASQPQALIGAAGIPLSPVQEQPGPYTGTLHITISTSAPASAPEPETETDPNPSHQQPPTIIVTAPMALNATAAARLAATPRTSTLPLPVPEDADADGPLATLDLGTMALDLDADAIMAAVPSLYAVDSVVAAVLAVAVADDETRGVLGRMRVYGSGPGEDMLTPFEVALREREREGVNVSRMRSTRSVGTTATASNRPRSRQQRYRSGHDAGNGVAANTGNDNKPATAISHFRTKWTRFTKTLQTLKATITTTTAHNQHASQAKKPKPKSKPAPNPQVKGSRSRRPPQIVIDEFSPVHHARYGPGSSREGQELPRATVRIIHGLY